VHLRGCPTWAAIAYRARVQLAIPPALRPAVARLHGERSQEADAHVELVRLPTWESQLVVHIAPSGRLRAIVAGPTTVAKYRLIVPGPFYLQLILEPDAARAMCGVPVHELTDRVVDLEALWGAPARELLERVAPCCDDPRRAASSVAAMLAARYQPRMRGADLARRAAARLRATPERSIRQLAAELGAGERTLRQALLDHVGLSPKRYARIARVRRVVEAAGRAPWAQLAAEHDFCDQAHLNAEFRALLGVTPRQYAARQLPFVRRPAA